MRRYLDRKKLPVCPGLGVGSFRICVPKPHKDIHPLLKIDRSVSHPGTASENLTSYSVILPTPAPLSSSGAGSNAL